MNSNEGLNRIAKAIRYLGYGIGVWLVVWGIWTFFTSDSRDILEGLGLAWGFAAFFAGVGWVTAWIIEGFAKPKD